MIRSAFLFASFALAFCGVAKTPPNSTPPVPAHQFGVGILTPEKKVIWNYDAPTGKEIHTATPIGTDHVLFIINGDLPVVRVVNIVTGATGREFALPAKHPISVHGQFRPVRLLKWKFPSIRPTARNR